MPNIIVTSYGKGIKVDFGDYNYESPQVFSSDILTEVIPDGNGVLLVTSGRSRNTWPVCHAQTQGYLIIDSINGIQPISQNHLIDLLARLMSGLIWTNQMSISQIQGDNPADLNLNIQSHKNSSDKLFVSGSQYVNEDTLGDDFYFLVGEI